ncbi:MAG TPA: sterol desaturase family protein [Chitinophagales bacterium]|nr:sterol desaturase family protein [Chitinophagales bacterium]
MIRYLQIVTDSFSGYWNYLSSEILHPSFHNYFYWLIALSLFCWSLEIIFPWRKNQSIIRKDFFLDGFYMFFNFFLFSLIGYNALSNVGVQAFNDFIGLFGLKNIVAIEIHSFPAWSQLLILLVTKDFIDWNVHRVLHRVPRLWEFHKVHHSVEQMGFAAHLRFHWMETIVYRSIEYIPLAMIGFGIQDFIIVHIFTLAIGHLNHSNLNISWGPFKYLFNSPQMHIWHHAKELPEQYGVNFGLTLSVWDYLFGTVYWPQSGRDVPLGFPRSEFFPASFYGHMIHPFSKKY